jgi:Xaa-Pro aminopeptidase
MDIHDTSSISHNLPLQPGMIITVEPGKTLPKILLKWVYIFYICLGVYVKSDNRAAPEEFRGIGIRIEDDVLITESGYEVLSSTCPKSVAEIERLMCRSECE